MKMASELAGVKMVVRELGISEHTSRIDVAAICEDRLEGFEIKSDADSHARFGSQNGSWQGVFDLLTLVTTKRHMDKVLDGVKQPTWFRVVPDWWGLILVGTEGDEIVFRRVREPVLDVTRLQPQQLIRCFWKSEMEAMAKKRLGWKSKDCRIPKYCYEHWRKLWQEVGVEELRDDLRNAYLKRDHLTQRAWKEPKEKTG
jgi:hypothetical protein